MANLLCLHRQITLLPVYWTIGREVHCTCRWASAVCDRSMNGPAAQGLHNTEVSDHVLGKRSSKPTVGGPQVTKGSRKRKPVPARSMDNKSIDWTENATQNQGFHSHDPQVKGCRLSMCLSRVMCTVKKETPVPHLETITCVWGSATAYMPWPRNHNLDTFCCLWAGRNASVWFLGG